MVLPKVPKWSVAIKPWHRMTFSYFGYFLMTFILSQHFEVLTFVIRRRRLSQLIFSRHPWSVETAPRLRITGLIYIWSLLINEVDLLHDRIHTSICLVRLASLWLLWLCSTCCAMLHTSLLWPGVSCSQLRRWERFVWIIFLYICFDRGMQSYLYYKTTRYK